MTNALKPILLSLVLATGSAALAQDAAAPAEGAAPPAETAESTAPTEEGPAIGQTYLADIFTDWQLRCIKTESGEDPCQLYQLLKDGDGNSVAEVNFFPLPPGGEAEAGAQIMTPLETLLTADLRIRVDTGQGRRYPYNFCTTEGCVSRLGFTPAEVQEFKAGANATVIIVPAVAPDATVELTMSLRGFTAGYNALRASAGLN